MKNNKNLVNAMVAFTTIMLSPMNKIYAFMGNERKPGAILVPIAEILVLVAAIGLIIWTMVNTVKNGGKGEILRIIGYIFLIMFLAFLIFLLVIEIASGSY